MNKLDFLRKLDRALSVLDKEERREIIRFYEERFYNGTMYENKTEEEVIAELETPEVIARNVLEEYGVSPTYVKTKEERYTNLNVFQVIMLLAFDVIIATWLIPTLVSVTLSLFAGVFSYVGTFSLLMGEVTTVDEFTFAFLTAGYVLVFLLGIFFLSLSISVFKAIIVWHLNVFKIKGREKWIKKMSHISVDAWFKHHRTARRIKNIALVGAVVTIIYTGLWGLNHRDWVIAEYSNTDDLINETYTEDFAAEITSGDSWDIVTDVGNLDVEVVLVSGSDLVIKHTSHYDDEFEYSIDYTNNQLVITNDPDDFQIFWQFSDFFNLVTQQQVVRIEVPIQLLLEDVSLETSNGVVDIRNFDIADLFVETSNGTIVVVDMNITGDATLKTTNGTISVRNITANGLGTLYAHTSNGTVDVENVDFAEYTFKSSNGRIELDYLNDENQDGVELDVETSNGSISMHDVYVNIINLDTSNGGIEFINTDTDYIPDVFEKNTTNGTIDTNVR
jgi:uncharacterized membrane protein